MKLNQAYRHAWKKAAVDDKGEVILDSDGNPTYEMKDSKIVMDSEYRTEPMTLEKKGDNLHGGDLVHSVISAGGGKYYVTRYKEADDFGLTDDQVRRVKHEAWRFAVSDTKRDGGIHGGKLRRVAEGIDSIIQAYQSNSSRKYGSCCTPEEAAAIMKVLTDRLIRLENTLNGAGQEAAEMFEI